jgi:hypothetical protein
VLPLLNDVVIIETDELTINCCATRFPCIVRLPVTISLPVTVNVDPLNCKLDSPCIKPGVPVAVST